MSEQAIDTRDTILRTACWFAALATIAVFVAVVGDIVVRGANGLSLSFLLEDPLSAGRLGGIRAVIISTLLILGICIATCIPIALGSAVFLSVLTAKRGSTARAVRVCLDVLASTPSIVFGLFGSAFFCLYLDLGFSTLAGGLTLACMILPGVIRMTEESINATPEEYRLNGAALGMSKASVFFHILLPVAMPAIAAALVIGIGRALSETAALLFTSGYVLRVPESIFDSGRSLSVHIYDLAMNVPGGDANAYRSAIVLLVVLLCLNSVALWVTDRWTTRAKR